MATDPRQMIPMGADPQKLQALAQMAQMQQQAQPVQPVSPSFESTLQLFFGELSAVLQNPQMNTSDKVKLIEAHTGAINKLLTGMASYHSATNQAQGLPPEFQMQMEQAKMQHDQTLSTLQHHHQVAMDEAKLELEKQKAQHDMQLKQAQTQQDLKNKQLQSVLTVQKAEHTDQAHQQNLALKEDAHHHQKEMAEAAAKQKDAENKKEDATE